MLCLFVVVVVSISHQLLLWSEAVNLENEISASGKLGGVAGVLAGANIGFNFLLLCAIFNEGVGGID